MSSKLFPILILLICSAVSAQVTKELPPNVERGLNLSLYSHCWQDSDAEFSHGGLLERPVLTAGDPQHVTKPGAVLVYAKRFSHAVLEHETQTQSARHSDQEILYVVSGKGWVQCGERRANIEDGTAVLLPPDMPHTIANT